jgi:hypothetical protein
LFGSYIIIVTFFYGSEFIHISRTTIAGGAFNSYDLSVARNVASAIAKAEWDFSSYQYASVASVAIASDDVTGYGVADDVLIPIAYGVATAGFIYDNWELMGKMEREIEGILSKSRNESQDI